jgi:adenylate cyclase, class 2
LNIMQWEVEQKFAVADIAAVKAKLAKLGVRIDEPIRQADRYFNHPARDFGQSDEALRLRQVGNENFVTYKGPKIDPATKTRRELELPLPSGADVPAKFSELFIALSFRPVGTVKKTRQKGTFSWEGHSVEAALDDVDGVGSFLELEIAADDASLDSAKTALKSLASKLDLGQAERRSYLELLLEKSS